jgi:hypothetical protein
MIKPFLLLCESFVSSCLRGFVLHKKGYIKIELTNLYTLTI